MGFDGLVVDGLIILVYFVVITAIGLYMGRRENSLHDFALGGRRVPWWAVMASIIAAETSAATFLGTPGEGYDKRSLAYVQLVIGLILGRDARRATSSSSRTTTTRSTPSTTTSASASGR